MNNKTVWIGGGLIAALGVVAFVSLKSHSAADGAAGSMVGAAPSPECAHALKANLDASGKQSEGYSVSLLNGGYAATDKQYESGGFSYDIAVRDSKTGAVVTTFKCSVDKDGAVVDLRRGAPDMETGQGPTAARN
jgi:hypothetical protein